MTRSFTHRVPEESAVNRSATAPGHCSERLPWRPKYVDHPELKGRRAFARLFVQAAEPTSHIPDEKRELHRFKRMHFCARRMAMLLEQYGVIAVQRSDYRRFARLHQQLRDDIAFDNVGLVHSLCNRSWIAQADEDELLSEGMLALTRAIEMFNPWLGFRFSTYACSAILRAGYRCGRRESRRRQRESVDSDFENTFAKSDWLHICRTEASGLYVERLGKILSEGTADLKPIEEQVLAQRFPYAGGTERRTLADIGKRMSLSKERVRQIERAALLKLRATLHRDPVLNPDTSPSHRDSRAAKASRHERSLNGIGRHGVSVLTPA